MTVVAARYTPRGIVILTLYAQGYITKEIALKLGISYRTVENNLVRLKRSLGAQTIAHAVAIGIADKVINAKSCVKK
jgi:DNA-binding CsgD family transcriptional regulator